MDTNTTNETISTNDSQDISTSQQESTSEGQYGYDDGNSTSSLHDSPHSEAISTAIMEVSGELMLGKFTPQKHQSGGSESSDISDDDGRRAGFGGAIAKYPESSTGLSDNDWNPYATESDTNQTPRSPRSNASDEQNRVGFVSKATINIGEKPKAESMASVSMRTGEVTVDGMKTDKAGLFDRETKSSASNGHNGGERLDILRYVVDNENEKQTNKGLDSQRRSIESRQSTDSGADTLRRESSESGRSFESGTLSGRPSSELDRGGVYVRDVREYMDSARSEGTGPKSGRQSTESGQSGRSSRSDMNRSGENGRQSMESQKSEKSDRSRASEQSEKSTGRSVGSNRSDRLERLSDAAGDSLKELIQFESAQRGQSSDSDGGKGQWEMIGESQQRPKRDGSGSPVTRMRLTARLEPYSSPVRSAKSPERSPTVAASSSERYISIAERERLLSDSPEFARLLPRSASQERNEPEPYREPADDIDQSRPVHSSTNLPKFQESMTDRSPSQISMRRVSNLFEETKRQAREAVALARPDPSGSEERFPLRERLTISKHDDSFKTPDKSGASEGRSEKSRDSETARSMNSEEVARVLARYSDLNTQQRKQRESADSDNAVTVSAFDMPDNESGASGEDNRRSAGGDASRTSNESDDEIARRVRAILSQTDHYGVVGGNLTRKQGGTEYVPRTMDYSRLQRDLQEIQDSLQDVPQPVANDSIHLQLKARKEGAADGTEGSPRDDYLKSLETTGNTMGGRESGVSEYGRRLVWDHGADLQYEQGYGGEFIGTMASSDTLSTKLRGSAETDTLTINGRPDSAVTIDTDVDGNEFQGTSTLTGADITRAERIVDQVMNRRAEGDLKESVEDIIARYRNERRDLFDRLQAPSEQPPAPQLRTQELVPETTPQPRKTAPILTDPDFVMPSMNASGDAGKLINGKKQPGLAQRVFKILTDEPEDSDGPDEKGMAKKVYKILASDRPQEQVNGILTETMSVEHEMLKKLVAKPKDDSSLDDSGLNITNESFNLEDKDVRKQLEYSTFSSPGKGDKSEFTQLREVTSAPYSALSNARSLLSNQLQKMSERNFDKSIELRTPYRQRIDCYPVYGVERPGAGNPGAGNPEEVREAWMPARRTANSHADADRDRALSNERFYLTDRDRNAGQSNLEPQPRQRTYSDPFENSPARHPRDGHARSKSEEVGNVSEMSQYSFVEAPYSPTERRAAQSPRRLGADGLSTPQQHRPQDYRGDGSPSPTESDTSVSRKGARFRPYRPAGSRDMYYTESGEETNESATTIESTHPGSDDAAPPYIPSHVLGTRRDEPQKHPIGIYGNKEKDALSTIDENSVKDEKEKAMSASTASGKDSRGNGGEEAGLRKTEADLASSKNSDGKRSTMTVDTGYHSTRSSHLDLDPQARFDLERQTGMAARGTVIASSLERQPRPELGRQMETDVRGSSSGSSLEQRQPRPDLAQNTRPAVQGSNSAGNIERPGFKTREEFQRDFERRERELKEVLSRRPAEEQTTRDRDSLGTSTRSDPGGMLSEDAGPRWEYRESDQMASEFRRLEPEPAYPQERLRYSRSRSDTDLVAISPTESQRYSSPMQPGTRFLELSTQPSPIFCHQDSLTHEPRGAPKERPPSDLPRVPVDRELPLGGPQAGGLPRVPVDREQPRAGPPTSLAPGELPRVPANREYRQPQSAAELPRVTERRAVSPPSDYPVRPLEPGSVLGPVDLGANPRMIPGHMRDTAPSGNQQQGRSRSPLHVRQQEMEVELEKLNKQLNDQVNDIQGGKPKNEEFEDNFPPSKKAQVLREVLEQEYMDTLPPNINDMWSRFKEQKEHSISESSLNSTRLDALSGLLQNPTQHSVHSFVQERTEENERKKRHEREMMERMKEESKKEKDRERKLAAERAAVERTKRREELKQRRGLSEEESNGSYSEILMEEERKRERRMREAKKEEKREKRNKSPSKKTSPKSGKYENREEAGGNRDKENKRQGAENRRQGGRDKETVTDIRARKIASKHSESTDTLFSIPEDASFEQSPSKAESEMKSRQRRHRHVIDPLMSKLRDKIKLQRVKIDKERRKELQRVEKLKKLEMLLNAKRKGKLSDKAIDVELDNVSTTSGISHSESSHMSDSTLTALSATESTVSSVSDLSSTLRDSTIDNRIKLQVKKYPDDDYKSPKKQYIETDSTESSDFSNIIVERIPEKRQEKKSKDKKSGSKGKKYKVDEFGNKIRKEKKEKKRKDVFGDVELTDKDIMNQLRRYEQYMTPERRRVTRDASTMYPSPITVSPPSRRRMRDVLMKSEAIQTSPSVRASSPSYAYDEVPVSPVPYMSRKVAKTSRRRPSPSPTRSTQTSISPSRRTTRSPVTIATRKSSRSPVSMATRKSSRSPVSMATRKSRSPILTAARKSSHSPMTRNTSGSPPRRRFSPPITRRQAQSPIWKPEREIMTPPHNSMFTPEYGDENKVPEKDAKPAEAWFISMKPGQPWRQPLKERQANAIRQEAWQPKSVTESNWKDILYGDVLKDKGDQNDVSRDTKFDLDPEGRPLGEDELSDSDESTIDIDKPKPLSKMTLQEAFQWSKQNTISQLRERQKRLNLAAEQRKMEAYLKLERDRLFQEERRKEANPDAHPYSENLFKPSRRIISKEEAKEMTQKKYKKLPEVLEQQKLKKRQEEYSVNRIKARLFNRKIQKKVLVKADKWGR